MGRIIRFPIQIATNLASEIGFGITPALYSTVRDISSASISEVPSERADRLALDAITVTFTGDNPATGENIYVDSTVDIDGIITVNFKSLNGLQSIVTFSDTYYLNIGTNQPGIPNSVPYVVTKKTVNGGIIQERVEVNCDSFNSLSNSLNLITLKSGMCIGKILIRCTIPFDSDYVYYSIGIDGDTERFIKLFKAPVAMGPVDITYGQFMEDKVEYVSAYTSNIVLLKDGVFLRMYRDGQVNQVGQMQVVIFYDQI